MTKLKYCTDVSVVKSGIQLKGTPEQREMSGVAVVSTESMQRVLK